MSFIIKKKSGYLLNVSVPVHHLLWLIDSGCGEVVTTGHPDSQNVVTRRIREALSSAQDDLDGHIYDSAINITWP